MRPHHVGSQPCRKPHSNSRDGEWPSLARMSLMHALAIGPAGMVWCRLVASTCTRFKNGAPRARSCSHQELASTERGSGPHQCHGVSHGGSPGTGSIRPNAWRTATIMELMEGYAVPERPTDET